MLLFGVDILWKIFDNNYKKSENENIVSDTMNKNFFYKEKNEELQKKINNINTIEIINEKLNVNNDYIYFHQKENGESKNKNMLNNLADILTRTSTKETLSNSIGKEVIVDYELYELYKECNQLKNTEVKNQLLFNKSKLSFPWSLKQTTILLPLIWQLSFFIGLEHRVQMSQEMNRNKKELLIKNQNLNLMLLVVPCFFQSIANNFIFQMKQVDTIFLFIGELFGLGLTGRIFTNKKYSFFIDLVIKIKKFLLIILFNPINYQLEIRIMMLQYVFSYAELSTHKKFFNKLSFKY